MKTTLLIISATLSLLASQSRADRLVIKGSDTLGAKLVPQLAEAFKAQHPDTTFDIAAEGSTTGIAAIIDGTAQIGMSSRRAKPAEVGAASGKGVNMKPTIVAYDGIAVIVNSANPIKGLTKKQVEQIFTGDVTDWSAVGGSPGKDFCLHPQHVVGHLLRLQGAGDEETGLCAERAEDGGERANRSRKSVRTPTASAMSASPTRRPVGSRSWRSMAQCLRPERRTPRLIPTLDRPSTTQTANRAEWRRNLSISRSARWARRLSSRSALCRSR